MMINSTLARLLMAFAMLALAYGTYVAYNDGRPGMAVLLAFGTIAAAIPVLVDSRK